jgi:hypothetical protein
LRTSKALAFAQSVEDLIDNDFDFLATPTVFGAKAQDVVDDDAEPALGWAHVDASFTIAAPGGSLPDFLDLLNSVDHAPASFEIKSQTLGTRPDGSTARLTIHQTASTQINGDGDWEWVFDKEIVTIESVGN